MENLQKAINYETLVLATHLSDAKVLPLYNQLKSWCDISASIGDNLQAYKYISGCDEDTLYKAQVSVLRAFETLSDDIHIITPENAVWPTDVTDLPFLYIQGNAELLKRPSISVVGTRHASEEGIELTRRSVASLGQEYVIVSGLARGIDCAAHIEALEKGFNTIAVIGTPVNSYYPPEHEQLQNLIAMNGLVVSQFAPCRRVQQYFFIQRNLTMSRISNGSLIVESSDAGGAVKQAKYSEEQHKNVFIFKKTYDDANLTWPKSFECPVIINDVSSVLDAVKKPVPLSNGQAGLF